MQHGKDEENVDIADTPAFDGGLAVPTLADVVKIEFAVLTDILTSRNS